MEFETLLVETDARKVATVWLNRPDKHNAMSGKMIDELSMVANQLAGSDTRVVVMGAKGRSFCAGGDLKWMQAQINATAEIRALEARKLAEMLLRWNTLPQPVIGRIHGNAFGGGVGLASVCDVAIGVDGAMMGLTETRLGLIPATIGPYVAARMGEALARRVFMSSRRFDTGEAVRLGLLASIVAEKDLDLEIENEVRPYLSCAPGAVASAKALLRDLGPKIDDQTISMTLNALVGRWEAEEAKQGIAAFFNKEQAPWIYDQD